MVEVKRFDGSLLHPMQVRFDVPNATVANNNDEQNSNEIEIMPSICISQCFYKLPVLKQARMYLDIIRQEAVDCGDAGFIEVFCNLYNHGENGVPDDIMEVEEVNFDIIGGVSLSVGDVWTGGSPLTYLPFHNESFIKKYTPDGILLKPTLTVTSFLNNGSGSDVELDSINVVVELDIDWIDVTKAEFDDYVKELWYMQAITE